MSLSCEFCVVSGREVFMTDRSPTKRSRAECLFVCVCLSVIAKPQ